MHLLCHFKYVLHHNCSAYITVICGLPCDTLKSPSSPKRAWWRASFLCKRSGIDWGLAALINVTFTYNAIGWITGDASLPKLTNSPDQRRVHTVKRQQRAKQVQSLPHSRPSGAESQTCSLTAIYRKIFEQKPKAFWSFQSPISMLKAFKKKEDQHSLCLTHLVNQFIRSALKKLRYSLLCSHYLTHSPNVSLTHMVSLEISVFWMFNILLGPVMFLWACTESGFTPSDSTIWQWCIALRQSLQYLCLSWDFTFCC